MKRPVSSSFSWKLSYKPRSCLNRMGGTAKQFSKDLRISFRFIISNQWRVFTRCQIFSPMQSSIMSSHLYMRARHLCHLASRCWRPTHKPIILLTTTWWFRIKTSIKYKSGRHISNSQYSGITWHLANKINFCYNLSLKISFQICIFLTNGEIAGNDVLWFYKFPLLTISNSISAEGISGFCKSLQLCCYDFVSNLILCKFLREYDIFGHHFLWTHGLFSLSSVSNLFLFVIFAVKWKKDPFSSNSLTADLNSNFISWYIIFT